MSSKSFKPSGTILLADDNLASRDVLEEFLTRDGYRVLTASDGVEALDLIGKTALDVVLLDVMMPHLSGFDVCRKLKDNPETYLLPVVLVTALSDTQDRIDGHRAGADDFLTRPVDRTELLARVQSLVKLKQRTDELERAESVLFALARSIEGKDPYTGGHCERLAEYSAALGKGIGLTEDQITALRRAGIVHDIGKVAVPDSILLKPAALTLEERTLMQEHAMVGERICAPLKAFRLVLPIIRHHHEKLDGSGYPDGLRGDRIPVTARVLQIVDVYDALTTARPYKRAFSVPETLQIMEQEVGRGWWDADIFEEFKKLVRSSADFLCVSAATGR